MKSVALALITLVLLAFMGISAVGFYGDFGNTTIVISDLMWNGINLIFALFVVLLCIQLFIIWIVVDQIGKLKKFIDNVKITLSKIQSDIEILL